MRCLNCGLDSATHAGELDVYAADGSIHTLPLAFCPACGWPLGRAQVSLWPPGELVLTAGDSAEFKVVLVNDGDGALYYSLDVDPRAKPISRPALHGSVEPLARREVGFRLASSDVAAGGERLTVTAYTLTGGPDVLGTARRGPVEGLWHSQELSLTATAVATGPVAVDAETLLFGLGLDEVFVNVLNFGGVALDGEATCSPGFLVCCDVGAGFAPRGRLALRPGRAQDAGRPRPGVTTLRVRRTDPGGGPPGRLSLRLGGQPAIEVALEHVLPAPPKPPDYRYVLGVDFGTSKTAVAWVDQLALPPRPQVFEWSRLEPGADARWLPSAVFYDRQYGQPVFGDQALLQSGAAVTDVGVRVDQGGRHTSDHGTLFVGMKMFLRAAEPAGQGPPLRQVVVDYFRHILQTIHERGVVDLTDTCLVLSVPVLPDAAAYQRQEELMRAAAAEAGALFGLRPEQITFEKEPVCAAIDLVRTPGSGPALQHGDWLCVFDCGAGTTDISLLQVSQQGGEWRFQQGEPLGYEWGGDDLDELLYYWLLGFWMNPDDPSNVPDSGPVTLLPRRAGGRPRVIDADAEPARRQAAVDWVALMREAREFQFNGASLPVTRSELLGHVSRFKEAYLNTARDQVSRTLTSETPVAALSPSQRGEKGPWAPLGLDDVVNLVSLEFLEMRDGDGHPLRARLPALFRQLGLLKPQWVCPVGGATLVKGWREAVQREPLALTGIAAGEVAVRRLHVARGAAQKPLFRVEQPLPEAVLLQVAEWTPGERPRVVQERGLAAGTPPGERQQVQVLGQLALQPGARLLLRVLLGGRVLRQVAVSWFEGADVVQAHGLGAQSVIRLEATLRYLREPNRLELTAHWLAPGEPAVCEPTAVELPRFEDGP